MTKSPCGQHHSPTRVIPFIKVFGGNAPNNALYVVEFGSNDIRDAMEAGDPTIVEKAVASVQKNIVTLYNAGAVKIPGVPRPGPFPDAGSHSHRQVTYRSLRLVDRSR